MTIEKYNVIVFDTGWHIGTIFQQNHATFCNLTETDIAHQESDVLNKLFLVK